MSDVGEQRSEAGEQRSVIGEQRTDLGEQMTEGRGHLSDPGQQTSETGEEKRRVIILISGSGSNMEAVIQGSQRPASPYQVVKVIADRPCLGLEKANRRGIPVLALDRTDQDFAAKLFAAVGGADYIVLAGFLSILEPQLIQTFTRRIINIHPSLLPAHGGMGMHGLKVHQAVLASGEEQSGCSCHVVTEEVDQGEILVQKRVPVVPGDTPEELAARILPLEHQCIVEGLLQLIQREKGERK